MIRVGLAAAFKDGWLGGVNYYRNLLWAIYDLPERQVESVLFVGKSTAQSELADFPPIEIIRTSLMDRMTPAWLTRKVIQRATSRDLLFERFLLGNRIDVLSHAAPLGSGAAIPTIGWIADFQHVHLPHMFHDKERRQRDAANRRMGELSARVVVSSADARQDFVRMMPEYGDKAHVLQFVARAESQDVTPTLEDLRALYQFDGPYLHVPNQFWAHKDHRTIVEALHILNARGRHVLVLATGRTDDRRQSEHFPALMAYAAGLGVHNFRTLGVVPRTHLVALMRHSVALINPSRFEGWSTSVEEAKALGKLIILSDLAVHKEQAPEGGIFFSMGDAASLADVMWDAWSGNTSINLAELRRRAMAGVEARRRTFALQFQSLVLSVARR